MFYINLLTQTHEDRTKSVECLIIINLAIKVESHVSFVKSQNSMSYRWDSKKIQK